MTDAVAAALVRALALVGATGVLVRWLLRHRGERVPMRTWLQLAPYFYWAALAVLVWHPLALATPGAYDAGVRPAGVLLATLGGALGAWAALHLGRYWDPSISTVRDHRVVDDGPFGIVRHPIYLGFLAFFAGGTLAVADPLAVVAGAGVAVVVVLRARAEERFLVERLGDAYRDYRRRVPMLLPLPRP